MTKSSESIPELLAELLGQIGKIGKSMDGIEKRLEEQDAKIAAFDVQPDGSIRKSAPANPNSGEIENFLRRRGRLQERLEAAWERPDLYTEFSETELRREMVKCEDRLAELGYSSKRAGLDDPGRSSFAHRGGRSNFLTATPSTVEEILGVRLNSKVSKSDEDEINVENCLVL